MTLFAVNYGQARRPHLSACAIFACALFASCQPESRQAKVQRSQHDHRGIAGAVDWLMAQQQADQLWHSEYYGNLKGGAAVTAFTLFALGHVAPDSIESRREKLQAAVDALARQVERRGCVANPGGPDYPTYGSAMLLVAVDRLQLQLAAEARGRLIAYLLESQIDEGEGYRSNEADYGGWDMEGSQGGPRRSTGTNISVGSFCCEALSLDSSAATNRALPSFRDWLKRCQNLPGDGGFFFHADRAHDGNKAGWIEPASEPETASRQGSLDPDRSKPRSYGTATADGLRAMLACGLDPNSEPVSAARDWLTARVGQAERVPGFDSSTDRSWGEGLLFYYWFALAKSLSAFPPDERRLIATNIREQLLSRQATDGSWRNESARMREDDPLIATGFAVISLALCEQALGR
jgi:hypothetical protein